MAGLNEEQWEKILLDRMRKAADEVCDQIWLGSVPWQEANGYIGLLTDIDPKTTEGQ